MRRGEIYWFHFDGVGSEPDGARPGVVVQHDRFNRSMLGTGVVAAITSNLRLARMPGNVRLRKGEGGLPRDSVVNVTALQTVDRSRLIEQIGCLSAARMREVVDGLSLVLGFDDL